MPDPIGFRQGERVKSLKTPHSPEFEGIIESVVVPKAGKRYVIIRDRDGHCHHRWFHEIEAIERNEGERADHDLLPDR